MYRRRYNNYRRYGYRRYGYNRYRYNRYPRSTYRKANSAYYSTRRMISNQEVKSMFLDSTFSPGTSINDISGICNILQGTGVDERVGRVIVPTSLRIKLQYQWDDLTVASAIEFRIIIGYWKPGFIYSSTTNHSPLIDLALNDVMEDSSIVSSKNRDNKYDSIFLYDKVHKFGIESLTKYIEITLKKKLRKHKIVFNDGIEDGIQEVTNNGLFMIVMGAPTVPSGSIRLIRTIQLNYKDT